MRIFEILGIFLDQLGKAVWSVLKHVWRFRRVYLLLLLFYLLIFHVGVEF